LHNPYETPKQATSPPSPLALNTHSILPIHNPKQQFSPWLNRPRSLNPAPESIFMKPIPQPRTSKPNISLPLKFLHFGLGGLGLVVEDGVFVVVNALDCGQRREMDGIQRREDWACEQNVVGWDGVEVCC
jgi:hypothetical protein